MHAIHTAERSRRSILLIGSTLTVLALCGCGANTAMQGVDNPNDILPATAIDANPDDFAIAARESEEPGKWLFSVKRLGERPVSDGLIFVWDFGDNEAPSGTEQTHAFEEPGRQVIIVTAKTQDGTVAFLLTLEIDVPAFNRTPKAIVGDDQAVDENASVFLDGSESFDADGDELTFLWRQVSGPSVFLTGIDEPIASFVTPTIDRDAQLVFVLEVSDDLHTGQATTIVNVMDLLNPAGFNSGGTPLCAFTVALQDAPSSDRLDAMRPLTVAATVSTVSGDLPTEGSYTWMFDGVADSGTVTSKRTSSRVFTTAGVHTIALALTVGGITVGCHSVQSGTTEAQVVVWPEISGKVATEAGNAVPGVTVSAGAGGTTAVTNAKGEFRVNVPYRWTGTVTVQHTDFDFDTTQVSFSNVQSDVANQGFVARPLGGTVPPRGTANLAPFASAGSDQTVLDADDNGFELVSLDGGTSTDSDGTIVNFAWSEAGAPLGLGGGINVILSVGSHSITLTVTDNEGATATDKVLIVVTSPATAQNDPPVASAGPDQSIEDTDGSGTEPITLDGSGSSDTDGTIVSYTWFADATMIATGTSPSVDFSVGVHTVTLVVTDDFGAPAQDVATITVTAPPPQNQAPIANAGSDVTVEDADGNGSESVSLDGRSSRDPDGSIVSYEWFADATMIGTGSSSAVDFAVGVHNVTLRVTDDRNATGEDTVRITVATPTPGSVCGDGLITGAELCESTNLNNQTCTSLGFASGTLACNATCSGFDTSQCVAGPGRTLYVDDNACADPLSPTSVGSGSLADPFCKIQQAADVVSAGDVVEIREGTYRSFHTQGSRVLIIQEKAGSSVSPIVLRNYNGENVSLIGTGTSWQVVDVSDSSYINISGIRIAGGSRGLRVHRSVHVLIDHVTIHGNSDGINIGGDSVIASDHVTISYCEVYDNNMTGILVGHRGGASKATNTVIDDCLIYDNGKGDPDSQGQGAYVSDASTGATQNTTFRNNVAFRNSSTQIGCENTFNCTIENNIMAYAGMNNWTDAGGHYGDGRGGKIGTAEGGQWNRNHILRGNIIFGNNKVGYGSDSVTGNNYFYHNTIVGNGHCLWGSRTGCSGGVFLGFDPTTEMTFYNNIVYGNSSRGDVYTSVTGLQHGSNIFGTAISGFASSDTNGIVGQDPQFLDDDVFGIDVNPAPSMTVEEKLAFIRSQVEQKFGLRSTSPAIDKGVVIPGYHCPVSGDVNPNQSECRMWYGSAPDIGAFEYNPGG